MLEGMGVLQRMEAVGSKTGKTARRVAIANSGELESQLQKAVRMQRAKEVRPAAGVWGAFGVFWLPSVWDAVPGYRG